MKNGLYLSLLFLLFSFISFGQSLSTSVDYITKKLRVCESADHGHKLEGATIYGDDCYYSIIFSHEYYKGWEYRFRFEDLDSNNITVKTNVEGKKYLWIGTVEGDDLIHIYYPENEFGPAFTSKDNSIWIVNENDETLERLRRAFINAIKMCNQGDPFRE